MVQFGDAAAVVIWLRGICAYAADRCDWDLLEEAAHTMCTWDGAWDQWSAHDKIVPWLRALKSEAVSVVAAVLRDHPESAQHSATSPTTAPPTRAYARQSAQARPHEAASEVFRSQAGSAAGLKARPPVRCRCGNWGVARLGTRNEGCAEGPS
jgi:hypothetical protein